MGNITGYLVDVVNNIFEQRTIEDKLEVYYGMLNCEYIECHDINIEGIDFTVIMDEEGSLKENTPSVFGSIFGAIMGSVFIVKTNYATGEFVGLNDKEIEILKEHTRITIFNTPVLVV